MSSLPQTNYNIDFAGNPDAPLPIAPLVAAALTVSANVVAGTSSGGSSSFGFLHGLNSVTSTRNLSSWGGIAMVFFSL